MGKPKNRASAKKPSKGEGNQKLTLGHSPDADDAFMFHALANGKISTGGFEFEHVLQDIQTLNERARGCELDIVANSFGAYPYVAKDYAILSSGGSMGDGYGPMVVTLKSLSLQDLKWIRIAIPGRLTSAFLALRLFLHHSGFKIQDTRFVVVPFDKIFEAVRQGRADAGLIIHEGQLTYTQGGFRLLLDLGIWWKEETGLPLPLGGNLIRRKLGVPRMKAISKVLKESIRYGLEHMDEVVPHLEHYARGLDDSLTRRFVKMYVNDYTLDYGARGKRAIREFLKQGAEAKFIPPISKLDFV